MFLTTIFLPQIHRSVPARHHHGCQHPHSGGPLAAPHADPDQRGPHGHGFVRYVHDAIPRTLAVLHVHLRESLQAPKSGESVSGVELYE